MGRLNFDEDVNAECDHDAVDDESADAIAPDASVSDATVEEEEEEDQNWNFLQKFLVAVGRPTMDPC